MPLFERPWVLEINRPTDIYRTPRQYKLDLWEDREDYMEDICIRGLKWACGVGRPVVWR